MSDQEKKKNISVSEHSMFRPKSKRRLSHDYPILSKEEVFKKLDSNELLFCWYYSHQSSPLYELEISPRERVLEAIKLSFEQSSKMNPAQKKKYLELDFTESMRNAMSKMESYSPDARVRSLKIVEKAFDNIEAILNIDATDDKNFLNKDDEVDMGKKKQYVETAKTAVQLLPGFIEMIESRFGVEVNYGEKEDDELSFIDDFHDEKR
jgi:hypothetical protein